MTPRGLQGGGVTRGYRGAILESPALATPGSTSNLEATNDASNRVSAVRCSDADIGEYRSYSHPAGLPGMRHPGTVACRVGGDA